MTTHCVRHARCVVSCDECVTFLLAANGIRPRDIVAGGFGNRTEAEQYIGSWKAGE